MSKKVKKTNGKGIFVLLAVFGIVIGALLIALDYFSKTITKLIVNNDDLDDESLLN